MLVTINDRKIEPGCRALFADGVNVHAFLMPRTEFRKTVEGTIHNSFMHSLFAKGRLLCACDQTIVDLCTGLGEIGGRDVEVQLLGTATSASGSIYKAHKWFFTRADLEYTAHKTPETVTQNSGIYPSFDIGSRKKSHQHSWVPLHRSHGYVRVTPP